MFMWLTSTAKAPYRGNHVFDSQFFYQIDGNNNLVRQGTFGPLKLATRAAKVGPDGLPVVIDASGHLREFVNAPSRSGVTTLSAVGGAGPAEIATIRKGADGKAEFLDAAGKVDTKVTPTVTPAMLPQDLGRLVVLAQRPSAEAAAAPTAVREQIARALTARKVLIRFATKSGPTFVEAGTRTIDELSPGQASTDGVLISQQNAVIFYEVLVNDVYAWYLTGRKTLVGIAPYYTAGTPGLFPYRSADLTAIKEFAGRHGAPLPDANALAIEVKLSWIETSKLPNGTQGYITARADVPTYNTSNSTDWIPTGTVTTSVALIGAHIVGSANGHPEMIWATFEHQANTPLGTFTYKSGGTTKTVSMNTTGKWLFSASGATPTNAQVATYCSPTAGCTTAQLNHIIATNAPTPIGPSNIVRDNPWGVALDAVPPNQNDATPAAANTEIISLDTDVRAKFGNFPDPRLNYLLIGATWTFDGNGPSGPYTQKTNGVRGDEIGTAQLANSTMETFAQGGTSFTTASNCFSCHTYPGSDASQKANTNVSHFFWKTNPLFVITPKK